MANTESAASAAATTTATIAYIPVLHSGYLDFLQELESAGVQHLLLIDRESIDESFRLHKDMRALSVDEARRAVGAYDFSFDIQRFTFDRDLEQYQQFVLPEDEVVRWIAEEYITHDADIVWKDVFLRWDKKSSTTKRHVDPDTTMTDEALHQRFMQEASEQRSKSADWWRQIGAVLVKDGAVVLSAHNRHLPDEQAPYFDGDPRGNFHKGEHIEVSTALHAEQALITAAAQQGIALEDAEIYVTIFPCPTCAKLLANTGIARVYYQSGYSMINGADILRAAGIDLVRVAVEN